MYESIIKLPFPFLQFLALVAESAKYHGTIFTNGLVLLNLTVIERHEERRDRESQLIHTLIHIGDKSKVDIE